MAKILRYSGNALFTIFFGLTLFRLLQVTSGKTLIALILLVPFLFLALYLFPCKIHLKNPFQWLTWEKAWLILQIPGIVVILAAFFTNRIAPEWDWGYSISIAIDYVTTGTTPMLSYVATYSNNQFWIFSLIIFFKLIRFFIPSADSATFQTALWILNAVLAVAAVNLFYFSARKLFSEKRAFFTGALAALFLPIYLYVQVTYTDIPGMFFCALMLYLYCRLRKAGGRERIVLSILLGITAAISYRLKVLVFILFIAIVIEGILCIKSFKKNLVVVLLVAVSVAGTFALSGVCVSHTLAVPEEVEEEYRFPATHWIMMGLRGNGGYNGKDYAYTVGISGYQEKLDGTLAKIEKRIQKKGFSGMMNHLFNTKVRRTWGNCMLSVSSYITRDEMQGTTLFQDLMCTNGKYSQPVQVCMSLYYILLMLGVFASGVASLIQYRTDTQSSIAFVCRVALVGFFIFETIWECNSRYLVCLLPVFLMASADGLYQIMHCLKGRIQKQ